MIEFVSAVPIIPAREVEAARAWYRDELGFDVFHVERAYGIVGPPDEHEPRTENGS